jgi:Na+-transporting NADH:ubiquinone oxidoreductase subunit NqrF
LRLQLQLQWGLDRMNSGEKANAAAAAAALDLEMERDARMLGMKADSTVTITSVCGIDGRCCSCLIE